MNNPPRTRAELVTALALYLDDQIGKPSHFPPLDEPCGAFLTCIEDWLQTDWHTLSQIYHTHNREGMVGMLMTTCYDQLSNEKYRGVRGRYSPAAYAGAAEAMVADIERTLRHSWSDLQRTFVPEKRVVYEGTLETKELER